MNSGSRTRKPTMLLWLSAGVSLMDACTSSTSNSPSNANGGAAGTGRTTGSGGVAQASSTATGGINSSGGVGGTGGTTGGANATGGGINSSGGVGGTGGTTGGANATGGGITASGSGGSTSVIALPPACPTHVPLVCPAIDSSKTFGSLSQAEVSALCDCESVAYGGYGTSQTCMCADGSMAMNTNPTSKAACVAAYKATPACTWLMSDYFKCMNLMQDPCNMMGMLGSLGDPSCAGGMNNLACAGQ